MSRAGRDWGLRSAGRRPALAAILAVCALSLSGCGWISGLFGKDDATKQTDSSVFTIAPGQCFNPPAVPIAEIANLAQIPCDQPHVQEAYAVTNYLPPGAGTTTSSPLSFPGTAALTTFADGTCAEAFTAYVGVSYLDSSLFFTYLLPSARSWGEQGNDRQIVCFITTTGERLTASVAGSKK